MNKPPIKRPSISGKNNVRYKHGHTGDAWLSSTYARWAAMLQRCYNPKHKHFKHYGGRGIEVCGEWRKFENFLNDMGDAPAGTHLDRIDNNAGYSKSNCRWASRHVSQSNKRTASLITFNNQTKNATDWAIELGMSPTIIRNRIYRGETNPERLLRKPENHKV